MNGLAVIVVYCPDDDVFQQIQASDDIRVFRRRTMDKNNTVTESSNNNDNGENDTSSNKTISELNQEKEKDEKEDEKENDKDEREKEKEATLEAMVHIVPRSLFQTTKYQDWIASFGVL